MTCPTALELCQVSHYFSSPRQPVVVALEDFTLQVAQGELLAVIGPSGCGKTTLLRLIAGLETIQNGTLTIAGQRYQAGYAARSQVGLVFQDYALFPHLSVADNIGFGLKKITRAQRRWRIDQALQLLELTGLMDNFPHQLSAGQQQRVALARSLVLQPGLLLLDEPFCALNPSLRDKVRQKILLTLKQQQMTTLLVTHDPDEVMAFADRVLLMCAGKVVQIGTPFELYTKPVDSFVAAFFGETNQLTGVVSGDQVNTPAGVVSLQACNCSCEHFDGELVSVIVRPEGVRLQTVSDNPSAPLALVESTKQVMHQGWVQLRTLNDHNLSLQARLSTTLLPPCGSQVALSFDHDHTFIFPDQHG